jgi:hypothetical protein
MSESRLIDVTGRLRSPAATPGHGVGCAPPNKGHLGITSIYLQGIDTREIVETIHHRRPPVISASAGLHA